MYCTVFIVLRMTWPSFNKASRDRPIAAGIRTRQPAGEYSTKEISGQLIAAFLEPLQYMPTPVYVLIGIAKMT